MKYLLDTNVLFILSRDSKQSEALDRIYGLSNKSADLFLSVVTLGELNSLGRQFKLGRRRTDLLKEIISKATVLDINNAEIITLYGEIDAYSQVKLAKRPNPKFSARNMGKNDLWIAATAAHYNLTLLTTDKDFDHLSPEFLQLEFVDQALLK